jgi:hypothetical protein
MDVAAMGMAIVPIVEPLEWGAETLADPYKGKIPLTRVNSFQEPFASRQDIQRNTPNTRRTNQYLEQIETPMKYLFPHITTE